MECYSGKKTIPFYGHNTVFAFEELAFHYFDNQAETENRSLPKPQEFSLIPPESDGGVKWSYDL